MDLELLSVFVQVVDSGTLSAAGRVVGLSPTLVSRRLKHLEQDLGVTLIQRTTRRLSVTDEGRAFYRRARRILDELSDARDELRPVPGSPRGTVRAVLPTLAVAVGVMQRVHVLVSRHPELNVQLSFSDQPVDLIAGGWDVGIHLGEPGDSTHVARRLPTAVPVLAATPEYLAQHGIPRRPEDLSGHDCLRFISDRPQDAWTLVHDDGHAVQVAVSGHIECDSSAVLNQAMFDGLGIGVGTRRQVAEAADRGDLVPVLPEYHLPGVPMYALMPHGKHRVPRVRAFVDWMDETFTDLLA